MSLFADVFCPLSRLLSFFLPFFGIIHRAQSYRRLPLFNVLEICDCLATSLASQAATCFIRAVNLCTIGVISLIGQSIKEYFYERVYEKARRANFHSC